MWVDNLLVGLLMKRAPHASAGLVVALVVGLGAGGAGTVATAAGSSPLVARSLSQPLILGMAPRGVQPTVPTSARLPGTRCRAFPADSWWHADVSKLPLHPNSADWLVGTGAHETDLHPDFGPAFGEQPVPYGIPITVVRGRKRGVRVAFEYGDESDNVRYPLSRKTKIEAGWSATGDRHAIVVVARTCRLYETWNTRRRGHQWTAGSGATWSLRRNDLRPSGWTSADAAGLPILPGLLRWDEIQRGTVDHAIRFTVPSTADSYVWPARHQAGGGDLSTVPPMGARFRLRASFPEVGFSPGALTVISAMKRHGLVVADNGGGWYFQGTSDESWPEELITELKGIPAGQFEAVDTSVLIVDRDSGAARP